MQLVLSGHVVRDFGLCPRSNTVKHLSLFLFVVALRIQDDSEVNPLTLAFDVDVVDKVTRILRHNSI